MLFGYSLVVFFVLKRKKEYRYTCTSNVDFEYISTTSIVYVPLSDAEQMRSKLKVYAFNSDVNGRPAKPVYYHCHYHTHIHVYI